MTEPLPIERLTRLDLKPTEVLAVTLGIDATPYQCQEYAEYLESWLHGHGVTVAGVVVLLKGSQLAAVTAGPKSGPCEDCGDSRDCPRCEGHGHLDGERCTECGSSGTCPTCRATE